MKGRHRRKRGHHGGRILAGLTLTIAASTVIISAWAGGVGGVADTNIPKSCRTAYAPAPCLSPIVRAASQCAPIILHDEPTGEEVPATSGRGEAGREESAPTPTPIPVLATSDDITAAAHSYMVDQAVALRRAAERQDLVNRITAYMISHNHVPGLIDLVPLMVDLGGQTGTDCRLCPVTLNEESSGGRRSHNLFGALGSSIGSCGYEEQVRWYFRRLSEIGGDVWYQAWYWHGGGSQGADHSSYADNITRVVQAI